MIARHRPVAALTASLRVAPQADGHIEQQDCRGHREHHRHARMAVVATVFDRQPDDQHRGGQYQAPLHGCQCDGLRWPKRYLRCVCGRVSSVHVQVMVTSMAIRSSPGVPLTVLLVVDICDVFIDHVDRDTLVGQECVLAGLPPVFHGNVPNTIVPLLRRALPGTFRNRYRPHGVSPVAVRRPRRGTGPAVRRRFRRRRCR